MARRLFERARAPIEVSQLTSREIDRSANISARARCRAARIARSSNSAGRSVSKSIAKLVDRTRYPPMRSDAPQTSRQNHSPRLPGPVDLRPARGLRLLDVGQSRPFLRRSRLLLFGHILPGSGFKAISPDVRRLRPQRLQHLARLFGVGNESVAFEMSFIFADQPFLGVPGTAAAFASDALNATHFAHVLCAESGELSFRPDLDVIVLALSGCSWFRPASSFRLRPGVFS